MIEQHFALRALARSYPERPSIEPHIGPCLGAFAEGRHVSVHREASGPDPLLDLASGAVSGGRQQLLQAFAHRNLI